MRHLSFLPYFRDRRCIGHSVREYVCRKGIGGVVLRSILHLCWIPRRSWAASWESHEIDEGSLRYSIRIQILDELSYRVAFEEWHGSEIFPKAV